MHRETRARLLCYSGAVTTRRVSAAGPPRGSSAHTEGSGRASSQSSESAGDGLDDPTFEILSRTIRCVSYDTRGTGFTEAHDRPISLPTLIDDLVSVLDAFEVERCVIAGESMGGLVALHAAATHPDRIEAVITSGSPPAVDLATAAPRAAAARADYPAVVRPFVTACLNDVPDGSLQRWGEALFHGATGESAARLLEALVGHPAPLAAVTQPVLVLHGTADIVVPRAAADVLVSGLANAELVLLEGAGHAPMVTRPADVASEIESWLARRA
ncbi:MAG: alpha/beta hydrolase [Actinomycetota bacterium]|nr:alpha/beta hydrolase [Actinomycetota bacterium]